MNPDRAGRRPSLLPRPAMTLVEVLLALTLATLALTLVGRMTVQTITLRDTVEHHLADKQREAFVLDALQEDLDNALSIKTVGAPRQTIGGEAHQLLQLEVLAAIPVSPEILHEPRLPAIVAYRLMAGNADDQGYKLVRELQDRTEVDDGTRETLAVGLTNCTIEVLLQDTWKSQYVPERKDSPPPRALRVTLRWPSSAEPVSRLFVMNDAG
jgi:hypothetical protein